MKNNKLKLAEKAGISKNAVTKMFKNEYISLEVVVKICKSWDCGIEDEISMLPKCAYPETVRMVEYESP